MLGSLIQDAFGRWNTRPFMMALSFLQYHARFHCSLSAVSRRGQHVRCPSHCKHSLTLSFLLREFYQGLPVCSSGSSLHSLSFWSPDHQVSVLCCAGFTCLAYSLLQAQRQLLQLSDIWYPIFTLSAFFFNQTRFLYWCARAKNLGTGACFSSKYSSDWAYARKDDVAIQDKRQGYKNDTNRHRPQEETGSES